MKNGREIINLPEEELAEILEAPCESLNRFIISAIIYHDDRIISLWFGDNSNFRIHFNFFTPGGKENPDFDQARIIDHGLTLKLGNYEAATDWIVEEHEKSKLDIN